MENTKGHYNSKFTAQQVIDAIKGTGGVKTVIAQRLGCHRHTVDNYIARYVTVRQAYEDEMETVGDFAESVLIQNIKLAFQKQAQEKVPVDASDSKWYLERKRRGYSRKFEAMLQNLDMSALTLEQLERLSAGEDPIAVLADAGAGGG